MKLGEVDDSKNVVSTRPTTKLSLMSVHCSSFASKLETCLDVVDHDRRAVSLRVGDTHLGDSDEATIGRDRQRCDRPRAVSYTHLTLPTKRIV